MTDEQINAKIRADQAVADTMHFPDPFEFKYTDTVNLSKSEIYTQCFRWLNSFWGVLLEGDFQTLDSINGKIAINNIKMDHGITQDLTIDIKEGNYTLILNNYLFSQGNDSSRRIPLLKRKDSEKARLDKYYIYLADYGTFLSLKKYIKK